MIYEKAWFLLSVGWYNNTVIGDKRGTVFKGVNIVIVVVIFTEIKRDAGQFHSN